MVSAILEGKPDKNLILVTGRTHPKLASDVAEQLGIDILETTAYDFANGEMYVRYTESVRGADVFLVQSVCSGAGYDVNDALMELLIMVDAAKRASARSVSAVVAHYGYARQDRKAAPREPITAKLVADLLEVSGIDNIITVDLHQDAIQGFFDIPVDNLLGNPIFTHHFHDRFVGQEETTVVVSPDVGSVSRARAFAQKLGMPLAIVDKRRQKANSSEVMNIIGDVRGKQVILFDDMVDTAGSLCGAAQALVEIGGATDVYACASHGVLSGPAIERIENSSIKEMVFLDTVPPRPGVTCSKIKYLSVADIFAEAIERIYQEVSVSKLFN